jgi:hypothetical protein
MAGNGYSGGTNGVAAAAALGGGPGGAPNASGGNSGPGQAPSVGPGGGGGGARASSQQAGGNGAAGQLILSYLNSAVTPAFINWSLASDGSTFSLSGTGAGNQAYVLFATPSLTPPVAWSPIATNMAGTDGSFSFSDVQAGNFVQRFYQVSTP